MRYFLAPEAVLKSLEKPSVYHIRKDDLYELDRASFSFLKKCSSGSGCASADRKFIEYCKKQDLLVETPQFLKRPAVRKSPVPSLRYLELQITTICNLKCRHCFIENPGKELSVEYTRKVLGDFEKMQGLRIMITGGEPLLHSSFNEINDMLPDFSVRKVLFTNGLLLNRKKLGSLNVQEIQISIDGLEEAHDSLRGRGTFKKAFREVREALDSGLEVSVASMVHSRNLNDFEKMKDLFEATGVKDWTVDIPCITGRLKSSSGFQVSPEQAGKYLGYGYGAGLHSGAKGYACGLHLMAVNADGYASKCSFYSNKPSGHIREGLRTCWRKIKPIKLSVLKCDCEFIEECRGGCRYRAELLGDPLGKDLYKCNYYGKIIK